MKKMVFLSVALSASLFAGDYGFRDYLTDKKNEFIAFDETSTVYAGYAPAGGAAITYCAVLGGNLTKTIRTDLGTEELKAIEPSTFEPYLKMTKEERIARFAKGEEKMDLKYTADFRDTVMGSVAYNTQGIGGVFECKDQSGKVLFSASKSAGTRSPGPNASVPPEYWVVEHKPEPMRDNVSFSAGLGHQESNILGRTSYKGSSVEIKEKLSARYPTYESYFDDWNNGFVRSNKKQKLNSNYRMRDSFSFDVSFWLYESMGELTETQYFCEAKNGTFLKDGQPFRSFLKQFYLDGARPQDFSTSPFIGNYACVGTSEAFTMELKNKQPGTDLSFKLSYALIKKGSPEQTAQPVQTPAPQPSASTQALQQPVSSVPQDKMAAAQQALTGLFGASQGTGQTGKEALFAKMGYNMADMNLVANAIATKAPFGTQQGANISTALYNGKDAEGCDLVSIEKSVANIPNSKRVYNYKSCNSQIIPLGETGLPGIPAAKELDPIIAQVKSQCKAYGAYGSEYQGTVVSCRSLDQNHCNLEINILKDGKLIDKRVEKTCK